MFMSIPLFDTHTFANYLQVTPNTACSKESFTFNKDKLLGNKYFFFRLDQYTSWAPF